MTGRGRAGWDASVSVANDLRRQVEIEHMCYCGRTKAVRRCGAGVEAPRSRCVGGGAQRAPIAQCFMRHTGAGITR